MSLESKIEALTAAVIALTAKLESSNVAPVAHPVNPVMDARSKQMTALMETVAQAPTPPAPANTITLTAAPAPVVAMPAPPSFAPVAPAPAPAGAPFSDPKGLIDYVMSSYKALGPQKGAQIQTVLTGLGYGNINDVKPEHYGALFAGVEALK
jgi:hypothetical protein